MRFLSVSTDGGPRSPVKAYWLIEIKWLFSIVLLRFTRESREEYHSHAFNSINWVLTGTLVEQLLQGGMNVYYAGLRPVVVARSTFHKVNAWTKSWVLSFRGPWSKTWKEYDPDAGRFITLGHGRKVLEVD